MPEFFPVFVGLGISIDVESAPAIILSASVDLHITGIVRTSYIVIHDRLPVMPVRAWEATLQS